MDLRKHLSHVTGTIQRRTESWLQLVGPLLELCQNGNPSTNEVTTNSFIHLFRRESFTSAHCWCNRWCVQGLIKIRKSSWSPFEILSPSDRIRDICLSYWCYCSRSWIGFTRRAKRANFWRNMAWVRFWQWGSQVLDYLGKQTHPIKKYALVVKSVQLLELKLQVFACTGVSDWGFCRSVFLGPSSYLCLSWIWHAKHIQGWNRSTVNSENLWTTIVMKIYENIKSWMS